MKRLLLAAIVAMAASGPAWAQATSSLGPNIMNDPGPGGSGGLSTATGTGVGVARSTSRSQAISGQGGTGVGVGGNPDSSMVANLRHHAAR